MQIKHKRPEKLVERTATPPVPPPPSPSVKGKEKEQLESPPVPPRRRGSAPPIKSVTPINKKRCGEILKNLLKLPQDCYQRTGQSCSRWVSNVGSLRIDDK